MTEVLAGLSLAPPGSSRDPYYYAMSSDHTDPDWRQQYYQQQLNQMPMLSSQWTTGVGSASTHGPAMGGMTEVDLRMFQQEHAHHYAVSNASYQNNASLLSPSMSYSADAAWPSDMEMGTPSTAGFPTDIPDGFHPSLRLQAHHGNPNQSPHSSIDGFSPHPTQIGLADAVRPAMSRSVTAPNHQQQLPASHRRSATGTTGFSESSGRDPVIKRSDASEDGDDEFVSPLDESGGASLASGGRQRTSTSSAPGTSTATTATSNRGRKRQRIPHTAVERRYRENLNAHLDKLRQTVPAFNQPLMGPSGSRGDDIILGSGGEGNAAAAAATAAAAAAGGMRPSKCEVLNGAIEHILNLDKENNALKAENIALRQRLEEVERWYHQQQQQHGGAPSGMNG